MTIKTKKYYFRDLLFILLFLAVILLTLIGPDDFRFHDLAKVFVLIALGFIYFHIRSQQKVLRTSVEKMNYYSSLISSVINSLHEAVLVADKSGNFVFYNEATEKHLGTQIKTQSPTEWSSYYKIYKDDKANEEYPYDQLPLYRAMQGEVVEEAVLYVRPKNKAPFWMNIHAIP